MKKALIIGSGIAGISCAIRLRVAGYEVEVFEKNNYLGGKLSEVQIGNYRFDAGPSLFTMPQFIEELFQLAEVPMSSFFEYKKKEIVCKYFFANGKKFTSKANREIFIDDICNTFNISKDQLVNYLKNSQQKYDLTVNLFLEKSLHKLRTYLQFDTIKAIFNIPILHLNSTLHKVNQSYFKDDDLVQFFNRYATYNGSSPYLTPGIMSLIPHLEQHYGTYFPEGGMISITNSLVNLAKHIGVAFYTNAMVDKIEVEHKKATGIWINHQFQKADIVVSNMDIVPTYTHLLPSIKAPIKTIQQERSSSALIFYWGIKKQFPETDLHNIIFANNYEAEFDAIFKKETIANDITIYLNISSKDSPNDAPKGCENWFILVNAPHNTNQDWDEIITRTRKNVIDKLSQQLNTNVNELIECESILDPRSIEQKTFSYQGSIYGASSNSKFAAFLRHPNFSKKIKNLYFCGGSVHPGGGIPLCLLSAKITADLIQYDQQS
jgi:phytoene desaturase